MPRTNVADQERAANELLWNRHRCKRYRQPEKCPECGARSTIRREDRTCYPCCIKAKGAN